MHTKTKLLCKTNGDAPAAGKPCVYFTCHPADFITYFSLVCECLFRSFRDCCVYYTEDMKGDLPEETRETDLERMQLFVTPVTLRLLTEPNRTMCRDLPFAREHNIKVLPLVMESELDFLYSRPENFGEMQYLSPLSFDITEVPFEKKLGDLLNSTLYNDELSRNVRSAFDTYIFLSYRKKDRAYANELMRLFHRDPRYRDIAVWYDEFLTPGESFRENIDRALQTSRLFALLVTPNLLEEPDGKPNFVMREEYPAARKTGLPVLPAQMEAADYRALSEKYAGLPRPVDTRDEAAFSAALDAHIGALAVPDHKDDPMHTYLIGLAYLHGIDVEIDRARGVQMIESAGEAGLPEAILELIEIYKNGSGASRNPETALDWSHRYVARCKDLYGEKAKPTLAALLEETKLLLQAGYDQEAEETGHLCWELYRDALGNDAPETLRALRQYACSFLHTGKYSEASQKLNDCYRRQREVLGEDDDDTLLTLNALAIAYNKSNQFYEAWKTHKKCTGLLGQKKGKLHHQTLESRLNEAAALSNLGKLGDAYNIQEACYRDFCSALGKNHPVALAARFNMAVSLFNMGSFKSVEAELQDCHEAMKTVFGRDHPLTLKAMAYLGICRFQNGWHKTAGQKMETGKQNLETCYRKSKKALGETHPVSLLAAVFYMFALARSKDWHLAEKLEETLQQYTNLMEDSVLKYYEEALSLF